MLNTQIMEDHIVVTSSESGHLVAFIHHKVDHWVVVLKNDYHIRSGLDLVKAFRSREAADYFALAAYLEGQKSKHIPR